MGQAVVEKHAQVQIIMKMMLNVYYNKVCMSPITKITFVEFNTSYRRLFQACTLPWRLTACTYALLLFSVTKRSKIEQRRWTRSLAKSIKLTQSYPSSVASEYYNYGKLCNYLALWNRRDFHDNLPVTRSLATHRYASQLTLLKKSPTAKSVGKFSAKKRKTYPEARKIQIQKKKTRSYGDETPTHCLSHEFHL